MSKYNNTHQKRKRKPHTDKNDRDSATPTTKHRRNNNKKQDRRTNNEQNTDKKQGEKRMNKTKHKTTTRSHAKP